MKFSSLLDDNLLPVLIFWLKGFIDRQQGLNLKYYSAYVNTNSCYVNTLKIVSVKLLVIVIVVFKS